MLALTTDIDIGGGGAPHRSLGELEHSSTGDVLCVRSSGRLGGQA
jgi:hypothetical protein